MRLWHEYIRRGDPTFVPFLAVALMDLEHLGLWLFRVGLDGLDVLLRGVVSKIIQIGHGGSRFCISHILRDDFGYGDERMLILVMMKKIHCVGQSSDFSPDRAA